MATITLEYDVRNKQAKEMIKTILSSGLAIRKKHRLEGRVKRFKKEKTETPVTETSTLPFSVGLWADYDIDDRTLRAKAWGTYKKAIP